MTNNCGGIDIREFRLNQIGLEEFEAHASVRIYPNPAETSLNIDHESPDLELKAVKIFDTQGKIVLFQEFVKQDEQTTISLSKLSPGIYQVMLESNYGYLLKKLFVK